MKLHQLLVFREVMRTGSVSDAARNLNRTQPSISAAIAALERDVDMRLFDRRGGRLFPVSEAHYLLEESDELLERVDRVKHNMRSLKSLKSGRLDIVSMPGPSVFLLPDLIANYLENKPKVACELVSRSTQAVYQLVAAQQYDFGLADYNPEVMRETSLTCYEVYRFDCLCAIPADDPIAEHQSIDISMLDGKPLACLYEAHKVTQTLNRVFAERSCELNIRFSTQYFAPLLQYVQRKLAYGIVDPIAVDGHRKTFKDDIEVVFRPLSDPIAHNIALITPAFRASSLLASEFLSVLRGKLNQLGAKRI